MPLVCKQLTRARMVQNFDLDFVISQEAKVTVPLAWQAENLVRLKLPIPTGVTTAIRVHERAAPVFEAWFRSWDKEACEALKEFGGGFVPRLMRMAKNLPKTDSPTRDWAPYLSRHSRGIALDFNHNYPLNKQGQPGVSRGELGSLWPIIDKARGVRMLVTDPDGHKWMAGVVCGIDWAPKHRDAMHFEIGEVR
jgi:hypothetical protein